MLLLLSFWFYQLALSRIPKISSFPHSCLRLFSVIKLYKDLIVQILLEWLFFASEIIKWTHVDNINISVFFLREYKRQQFWYLQPGGSGWFCADFYRKSSIGPRFIRLCAHFITIYSLFYSIFLPKVIEISSLPHFN